jgi:trimeric autotransporter adhesin
MVENTSSTWADYVFNEDYKLMSLLEVESFIKLNKHLPEIPSADEVKENGHKLGEMDVLLLKKVEELTLYLIDLKREVDSLKEENKFLKKELNRN